MRRTHIGIPTSCEKHPKICSRMISAAKKRCGLSDMTSLLNNGGPSGMCCFSSWASCDYGRVWEVR